MEVSVDLSEIKISDLRTILGRDVGNTKETSFCWLVLQRTGVIFRRTHIFNRRQEVSFSIISTVIFNDLLEVPVLNHLDYFDKRINPAAGEVPFKKVSVKGHLLVNLFIVKEP